MCGNCEPWIPENHSIIGECSLCGGPVIIPTVWFGIIPPIARCASCGATERKSTDYGPIIPMNPPTRGYRWTTGIDTKYDPEHYTDSWLMH